METIEASIKLADGIATNGTKSIGEREIKKEAIIQVAVPGLEPLIVGDDYVLSGQFETNTCVKPVTSAHRENHFGDTTLRGHIAAISRAFRVESGLRLRVNDMSLNNGGLFDVNNDWRPTSADCIAKNGKGHCGHRSGINADIEFHGMNNQNECILYTTAQRGTLLNTIKNVTRVRPFIEGGHYHTIRP
jgi:hypothetical protein